MSDFEKRVDPNATIQIDKIDALELVQLEDEAAARAAESIPPPTGRRTAPPPLPPMPPMADVPLAAGGSLPPASVHAPAPPRSASKNLALGGAFLLLLVGAIAGGLFFGARIRGAPAAPVASAAAPPASAAPSAPAAAPAATASSHTLNLPAVEISGP